MTDKYIQNTYSADIQIVIKDNGRFVKNMIFPRYQMDRASGQVVSDGFTEVTEEDLKALNANGAFKLLVTKKKLVIKDEAPLKAGSFEQVLNLKARVKALEEENARLKEKLSKYEGDNAQADDGLDKMKLDELKAKATELGLDVENFTKKADVISLIRETMGKGAE